MRLAASPGATGGEEERGSDGGACVRRCVCGVCARHEARVRTSRAGPSIYLTYTPKQFSKSAEDWREGCIPPRVAWRTRSPPRAGAKFEDLKREKKNQGKKEGGKLKGKIKERKKIKKGSKGPGPVSATARAPGWSRTSLWRESAQREGHEAGSGHGDEAQVTSRPGNRFVLYPHTRGPRSTARQSPRATIPRYAMEGRGRVWLGAGLRAACAAGSEEVAQTRRPGTGNSGQV